jgi:hypothetical protein
VVLVVPLKGVLVSLCFLMRREADAAGQAFGPRFVSAPAAARKMQGRAAADPNKDNKATPSDLTTPGEGRNVNEVGGEQEEASAGENSV